MSRDHQTLYWSHECTPSWASDDEEEYTEVTEKYWRKLLGQLRNNLVKI